MQIGTLSIVGGDNTNVTLTITQSDGVTPYNLTSCTLNFTAIQNVYLTTPVLTKVATITNATAGLAQLSFVPADTTGLNNTPYNYNIQLVDSGGNITTLISGPLNIVSSFT